MSNRNYEMVTGFYANRPDRAAVSVLENGKEIGIVSFSIQNKIASKLSIAGTASIQDIENCRLLVMKTNI